MGDVLTLLIVGSVKYVSGSDVERAKELEMRFQYLPPEAGVLFVSITPVPVQGGRSRLFDVRLGMSRSFDEGTGLAIVRKVLQVEIESKEIEIQASIYRGVAGAAVDEDPKRPDQSS